MLKSLKNNNLKNISNKELKANEIREKIYIILSKQKIKIRKLLTNKKNMINSLFQGLSDENYESIKKFKSINNTKIKSLKKDYNRLSELFSNINKDNLKFITKDHEKLAKFFSKLDKLLEIKINNTSTKKEYLDKIENLLNIQQNSIINNINNNFRKSLNSLNKYKNDINNLYKTNDNVNVTNSEVNNMIDEFSTNGSGNKSRNGSRNGNGNGNGK